MLGLQLIRRMQNDVSCNKDIRRERLQIDTKNVNKGKSIIKYNSEHIPCNLIDVCTVIVIHDK